MIYTPWGPCNCIKSIGSWGEAVSQDIEVNLGRRYAAITNQFCQLHERCRQKYILHVQGVGGRSVAGGLIMTLN